MNNYVRIRETERFVLAKRIKNLGLGRYLVFERGKFRINNFSNLRKALKFMEAENGHASAVGGS